MTGVAYLHGPVERPKTQSLYSLLEGHRPSSLSSFAEDLRESQRNTLDLSAVPLLEQWSHLPVIVDPSHGTGISSLVPPMARAAIACGADGLLIEGHPHPERALSDGPQSLTPRLLAETLAGMAAVAAAVGRTS